jgi:NSS family neurotransmitter:Na+ symporter
MVHKIETFSSRFGLIAATLGMAIGAGNIWRFPRLAGEYGGTFLIPWLVFLFLWSIPLLLVEYSVGVKTRTGVLGVFAKTMGRNYTWMGWFVAICASAILFYYSVVVGWTLKYFVLAVTNNLTGLNHEEYWTTFSANSIQPAFYHFAALGIATVLIYMGVVKGIERFSKIIIPGLYILLIISAIKAFNLPGAGEGVSYMFSFDLTKLTDHKIWLDGLSQSAWSTGAGWGMLLTYAIYAKNNESTTANVFITSIGNNVASVLAGLVIIPTIFALSITPDIAKEILASGNEGLAFIAIPKLFAQLSGGGVFAILFFSALFFAALSSLIAMVELASRVLMDFGLSRKRATLTVTLFTALLGLPSALSVDIFANQDWVWGLGLMVSGLFFNLMVLKIGVPEFVDNWYQPKKNVALTHIIFKILFYFLLPLQFLAMVSWWFYQSIVRAPETIWDVFDTGSLGTTLMQWTLVIIIGLFLNQKLNKWLSKAETSE